jgi:endonuclease/exonuclease/phosphatase (EEP) superfamily protein YafD
MRTVLAWVVTLPWAVWALVRLLGLESGYPVTALIAFTHYAAVAALLAFVLTLVARRRIPAVVAAASAAALVAVVAPRAVGDRSATDGQPLRVLTINASYGGVDAEDLAELVRRESVDVLSVQELTEGLDRALRRSLPELPHAVTLPGPRSAGTGLYARVKLTAAPAALRSRNAIATARTRLRSGQVVQLTAIHPPAPMNDAGVAERDRELGELPDAGDGDVLRVLAGDFNATLDHRALRQLLERGYADAAERAGEGLVGTWPSGRRIPPTVTIDHVLVDDRIGVRNVRVHDLPDTDHRAVFAELVIPAQ